MVPNGWKLTSLGEVCSGNLQTGPFGSQLHAHEYTEEGIPVLMPKDLISQRADYKSAAKIPANRAADLSKHFLKSGDILFSRRGDVSRFALIEEGDEVGICGTGCLKATPNSEHSSLFLSYFLQKNAVKRWLEQNAVGQTMPNMNTAILSELPLMTASSKEEDKIAKIISVWDKAIGTTERLIENSKQQKKALMQQLLTGKKRLFDDSGKPFEGEWEEVKLSQLVKVIGGNAFKSEEFKQEGIPLVKISNIKPDYSICLDSAVFILENDKFEKFKVKKGHILIAMSGATTGKVGCYQSDDFAYLNQRVGRFDVKKNRTTNRYLFQLLKLPKVQHEILIDAVGGAQPNISNKDIERIKIYVPAVDEQKKIASVLSNADQEIEILHQQLADLKQEKKALMQQLLTGKRRVSL